MINGAPRKILLYGDFHWDRLGSSYRRAFEQLGFTVECLDVRDMRTFLAPLIRHRIGHRVTIHNLRRRRIGSVRWNQNVLDTARRERPNLTFVLNGEFLMPETVRDLRVIGSRVFIFHADNPFPPHGGSRPEDIECARESDCYFIWSRALGARLLEARVARVEYLPFGWDSDIFPYLGQSESPKYDVVFVGGWDRDREAMLTPIAKQFNLKIWGPGYWGTRTRLGSPLRRCWQGTAVVGPQAAQVFADAKIILNIVRRQNLPDGTIMRTFEVPGSGGFLLSTRTTGALEIFPEGRAGAYFTDEHDLFRKIEYYLGHERECRDIAREAHDLVTTRHRYVERARRLLEVYSGFSS
jgi:spore maturation protein CgeB